MLDNEDYRNDTVSQAAARMKERLEKYRAEHGDQPIPKPKDPNMPCSPDCPLCGGVGWIRQERERDDPLFGRLDPCPNISVWKLVGSTSGLDQAEMKMTFANLLHTDQKTDDARKKAETLLQRGYGWLTMWGEYGTAKTHILKICTATILQQRRQAVYVRMAELLQDLRAAFDEKNPNEAAIRKLDWYAEVYFLAIDEFDRLNNTPWASEQRFMLMDKRYELGIRRKGITMLAMNSNPAKLEGYLADRITDGRFMIANLANKSLRQGLTWEDHQRIYQGTYEGDNWNTTRREETGGEDG